MKNKVLRLAIVAVLVVAMVLSMAACTPTVPGVSTSPNPGVTVSPSPVVKPTPTKTPVVPGGTDDDSALAKSTYGIEITKMDFTYGKVRADITKPVTLSNSLSTVEFKFDSKLLQNYLKSSTVGDRTNTDLPFTLTWKVEYEGEAKLTTNQLTPGHADNEIFTTDYNLDDENPLSTDKHITLTFTDIAPVGVYTVTAKVVATDIGFDFGRFGALKEEVATYELVTIVNVAKADLVIKTPSFVAPVQVVEGINAPEAPSFIEVTPKAAPVAPNTNNEELTAGEKFANQMKAAYETNSTNTYKYAYRLSSMVDTTKTGSYEFAPFVFKNTLDVSTVKENEATAFEDLNSINYNVTFENGKQYFISQYDWNVVRDTATSIIELDLSTQEALTLARTRYDALTTEQKVFFESGVIGIDLAGKTSYNKKTNSIGMFTDKNSAAPFELNVDSKKAGAKEGTNSGSKVLKLLKAAEKAAEKTAIYTAFDKAVKDAKFSDYIDVRAGNKADDAAAYNYVVEKFNVENATHVAAYNAVKAHVDALTPAQRAVLEKLGQLGNDADNTANGVITDTAIRTAFTAMQNTISNYHEFASAAGLFGAKAVNETKALIAASVAAYNRAVLSAEKAKTIVFTDKKLIAAVPPLLVDDNLYNGVVFYVNSAEVKAVTAQAKAAYDKLSLKDQKALDAAPMTDGTDAVNTMTNYDRDITTYGLRMKALLTMNEVVGHMEQVVNHTKIEDLAHTKLTSVAYNSLRAIVYGFKPDGTALGNTKGYVQIASTKEEDLKRKEYNAVADIMRAYATDSASLEAVVAEYKAMIDYVLAAEAYKTTVIASLNAAIAEEFTIANDKTETDIAIATAPKNAVLEQIALIIGNEKDPKVILFDAAIGTANLPGISKKTAATLLGVSGIETYAEAIESFEGMYSLDNATKLYFKEFGRDVVLITPTLKNQIFFDFT